MMFQHRLLEWVFFFQFDFTNSQSPPIGPALWSSQFNAVHALAALSWGPRLQVLCHTGLSVLSWCEHHPRHRKFTKYLPVDGLVDDSGKPGSLAEGVCIKRWVGGFLRPVQCGRAAWLLRYSRPVPASNRAIFLFTQMFGVSTKKLESPRVQVGTQVNLPHSLGDFQV